MYEVTNSKSVGSFAFVVDAEGLIYRFTLFVQNIRTSSILHETLCSCGTE